MRVSIRTTGDVVAYRALMLEVDEQAPDAVTTTAAEREAELESWPRHKPGPALIGKYILQEWEECIGERVAIRRNS